jgi:hypothetical protein
MFGSSFVVDFRREGALEKVKKRTVLESIHKTDHGRLV